MKRASKDLLTAPVGKTMLELAAPFTLGLLAVILFGLVDTFWVGRLGATELAAMSFTFPVSFLIMAMTLGLGVGVTASISRAIGEGDQGRVRRLTTDGLILANSVVVVFALGGLLTIRPLFSAMGASPQLVLLISQYMVPWYAAVGFLVIPMVGNSAIRATGDTKTPSIIMIIAGGVNMVLDPLLIFGIGPFPRLELQGAAIATAISWTITFAAAFWILARREHMLDFSRPGFAAVWRSWKTILHVGIPAAATNAMVPFAGGILTRMAAQFGEETVAAFGVGTRIESLSIIGCAALAASSTPFVGQNYGAGHLDRLKEGFRFSTVACLIYSAVIAVLLALVREPLARVFNDDPRVTADIVRYVTIIPITFGLQGVMLVANAYFNGLTRPLRSAWLIIVRLFVLAVPLAFVGSIYGGVTGMFFGIAAANALAGLYSLFVIRRFLSQLTAQP